MIVTITFNNDSIKRRFIEWVAEGNERSSNSFGGSGISAFYKPLTKNKYLFFWRTNSPIGDTLVLRILLFFLFRKRRKELTIRRISKEDLVDLILSEGS